MGILVMATAHFMHVRVHKKQMNQFIVDNGE